MTHVHADPVAEDALLASMYLEPSIIDVLEGLDPSVFYRPANAPVFAAMLRLRRRGEPIDLVTIRAELVKMGDLERAGGDEAIVRLGESIPRVDHAEAYARRVVELHALRGFFDTVRRTSAHELGPIEDVPAFLAKAAAELTGACVDPRADAQLEHISTTFDAVEKDLAERQERGVTGATTGIADLDKRLGGMDPGWLVIVAGRPGMGKSALAQLIARTVAERHGPVAIFSLEMATATWITRMAFAEASIDSGRARAGQLNDGEWARFRHARARLSKLPIHIDDTPGISPHQLRARVLRAKAKHGLALVVVDYLQLMRVDDPTIDRDEGRIAEVSRSLKEIAKQAEVPVVAVAQLNRDVEKRAGDRRPQISDLRNSGQIEQDADAIAFVYRAHHYFPEKADPRAAEIILAKSRHSGSTTVKCRFEARYTRFEDEDDFTDQDSGQRSMPVDPARGHLPPMPDRAAGEDLPWR